MSIARRVEPIELGWMGAGYLTAGTLDPDGKTHRLAGRYGVD